MTRRLYVMIVGLVGIAVVGLLVYGVSKQSPTRTLDDEVAKGLHPAAPDPRSSLPLLVGSGERSLSSFEGKVVVLNFWASWCEPCQEEAPRLEKAARELTQHDGVVLGVAYLDASPDSLSFVKRYRLTYPSLRDTTGDFAHAYGTNQLPESFVIDRDGHVVAISRGEVDEAFLKEAVALAERS